MNKYKYVKMGILCIAAAMAVQMGCADDPTPESCVNRNACGGCDVLSNAPGQNCGTCGSYVCDGINQLKCEEQPKNACGGCGTLESYKVVGAHCGSCGKYECNGVDSIVCSDPGRNSCGGCSVLEGKKGEKCGSACGVYKCLTAESIECEDLGQNACGGCSVLEGTPGNDCGTCGKWICDGQEKVKCDDPGLNECGGCGEIVGKGKGKPGEACGECGKYVCSEIKGSFTILCNDPGLNECGGCEPLNAKLNSPCGEVSTSCSIWTCDGTDKLKCGSNEANACGGCEALPYQPGDLCSDNNFECCTYVCQPDGTLGVDKHNKNSCGGCAVLEHNAGETCGNGKWTCDPSDPDKNTISCECDHKNVCGGCSVATMELGDSCTYCGNHQGFAGCLGTDVACAAGDETGEQPAYLYCDEDSNCDSPDEYASFSDRDDSVYSVDDFLIDSRDVNVYAMHVKDESFGFFTPEVWIENAPAWMQLCIYALEDKLPANPELSCKGKSTEKDSTTGKTMSVSANESSSLTLEDGLVASGFCTTVDSATSQTLFLQIDSFTGSSMSNNSSMIYFSVSSEEEHALTCENTSYKLKFRF